MSQTNNTQPSAPQPGQSGSGPFLESFNFVIKYFRTLCQVLTEPNKFVIGRDALPNDVVHPAPFLIFSVIGFCITANNLPIMSDPILKTSFKTLVERFYASIINNSADTYSTYIFSLTVLVFGIVLIIAIFSHSGAIRFSSLAGLTAYFIVAVLFIIVLRYLIEWALLSILTKFHIWTFILNKHYFGTRFYDIVVTSCLSVSIFGYPYFLMKEFQHKVGYVAVGFILMASVFFISGSYLKKAIANRKAISATLPNSNQKDSITISTSTLSMLLPKVDSASIPSNKTIILSSAGVDNIDPNIHFIGHRSVGRGKYSMEASFNVTNTTNETIYILAGQKVSVAPSTDNKFLIKKFFFNITPQVLDSVIGKGTKTVTIKQEISKSDYFYWKSKHTKGINWVLIRMLLFDNKTKKVFEANKNTLCDYYFH